ncbi:MAG: SpoIIE family protein phosphatase [Leptospiraceae bacterium]|nr:SpoIIE family protein phosphatase [Leptospiraceae bacterium]
MTIKINKDILSEYINTEKKEKKHKVLIVDDEEPNLRVLRKMLEKDYEILEATNGKEALDLIHGIPTPNIHLIICDQRMPVLTGVEFLEKSIAIIPNAIRIILTGYTDIDSILQAINNAQIYKFIAKPFNPDDLKLTVRRAIENYELQAQNIRLIEELKTSIADLREEITKRERLEIEKKLQEEILNQQTKIANQAKELENLNLVLQANNQKLNETLRLIKLDLNFAKKIQVKLLPESLLEIDGLNICSVYVPMEEVGGDIFDIVRLDNGIVRIMIADAIGHGVQAALITMLIKSEFETIKHSEWSTSVLMYNLNNIFFDKYASLKTFFTCCIVEIDIQKETITYSSAGHLAQLLIKDTTESLSKTGKVLGLKKDAKYKEITKPFQKGDKLLLFTDGLLEEFSDSGELFGEDRLLETISVAKNESIQSLCDFLLKSLDEFLAGYPIRDDIALIGVEYKQEIG